jgi:hypothetical protein
MVNIYNPFGDLSPSIAGWRAVCQSAGFHECHHGTDCQKFIKHFDERGDLFRISTIL